MTLNHEQDTDVRRRLQAIWRRKWFVLLIALAVGLVAFFLVPEQPVQYEATATVRVDQQTQNWLLQGLSQAKAKGSTVGASPQALIATSSPVLRKAAEALAGGQELPPRELSEKVTALQGMVTASSLDAVGLIEIRAKASSEEEAVKVANAVADAFIAQVREDRSSEASASLDLVTKLFQEWQQQGGAVSLDPVELSRVEEEVQAAASALGKLEAAWKGYVAGQAAANSQPGTQGASFSAEAQALLTASEELRSIITAVADELPNRPVDATVLSALGAQIVTASSKLTALSEALSLEARAIRANAMSSAASLITSAESQSGGALAATRELRAYLDGDVSTHASAALQAPIAGIAAQLSKTEASIKSVASALAALPADVATPVQAAGIPAQVAGAGAGIKSISSALAALQPDATLQVQLAGISAQVAGTQANLGFTARALASLPADIAVQAPIVGIAAQIAGASAGIESVSLAVTSLRANAALQVKLAGVETQLAGTQAGIESISLALKGLPAAPMYQDVRACVDQFKAARVILGVVTRQLAEARGLVTDSVLYGDLLTAEGLAQRIANTLGEVEDQVATLPLALARAGASAQTLEQLQSDLSAAAGDLGGTDAMMNALRQPVDGVPVDQAIIQMSETLRAASAPVQDVTAQIGPLADQETDPEARARLSALIADARAASAAFQVASERLDALQTQRATGRLSLQLGDVLTQIAGLDASLESVASSLNSLPATPVEADVRSPSDQLKAAQTILGLIVQGLADARTRVADSLVYGRLLTVETGARGMVLTAGSLQQRVEALPSALVQAEADAKALEQLDARIASNAAAFRSIQEMVSSLRDGAADGAVGLTVATAVREASTVTADAQEVSLRLQDLQKGAKPGETAGAVQMGEQARAYAAGVTNVSRQLQSVRQTMLADPAIYTQLVALERQAQLSRMLSDVEQVELGDHAYVALRVATRSRVQVGLIGALAGLLVGVFAALVLSQLDRSIQSEGDARRALGVPVLASIPGARRKRRAHGAIDDLVGSGSHREPLSRLAVSLEVASEAAPIKSLLVTSADKGEGKTTIAVNLARLLGKSGKKVLLVDWNLDRPRLTRELGLGGEPGLAALMEGNTPLSELPELLDPSEVLHVLPAGSANGAHVPNLSQVRLLIRQLEESHDIVIIDGPSAAGSPFAQLLGRECSGVCVVVQAGKTDRDAVREAVQELESNGAKVLGIVLNQSQAQARAASPRTPKSDGDGRSSRGRGEPADARAGRSV